MRLDHALGPGQTGCLRRGKYGGIHRLDALTTSGTAAQRVTIRSYPGEAAKIVGYVVLQGSYVTLSHVRIVYSAEQ